MDGLTAVKSALGILVVRGGAIGDFVLTLPVLSALRRRFPGTRLTIVGRPGIAELARVGGLADEILSVETRGLAGFLVRDGDLDPASSPFLPASP